MAIDPVATYGPALRTREISAALNPSLAALGLVAETMPRKVVSSVSSLMIDGTAYFVGIDLYAGQVLTNMVVVVSAAGVTMTLSKAGVYRADGTRLAVTADQGTAWESAGVKVAALTSAYTVPTSGMYYFAIVAKGGTLPGMPRGISLTAAARLSYPIGSGAMPFASQTGQTDLPATATMANASDISYWIGAT